MFCQSTHAGHTCQLAEGHEGEHRNGFSTWVDLVADPAPAPVEPVVPSFTPDPAPFQVYTPPPDPDPVTAPTPVHAPPSVVEKPVNIVKNDCSDVIEYIEQRAHNGAHKLREEMQSVVAGFETRIKKMEDEVFGHREYEEKTQWNNPNLR